MIEFDGITAFLAGVSVLATFLFARTVYKFRREHRHAHKRIQEKASDLEFQAQSLKSDFRELHEANGSKVDLEYLNKRIDALINLLNAK